MYTGIILLKSLAIPIFDSGEVAFILVSYTRFMFSSDYHYLRYFTYSGPLFLPMCMSRVQKSS